MNTRGGEDATSDPLWSLEVCEVSGQIPFETFVSELGEYEQLVLDAAIKTVLAREGTNVCATEWGKPLGKGLYEFRIRRSLETICNEAGVPMPDSAAAKTPVLLRVFFTTNGKRILLLIGGYDKQRDPSEKRQSKEIKAARKILTAHLEAEKKAKKRRR